MKTIQSSIATICIALLLASTVAAQAPASPADNGGSRARNDVGVELDNGGGFLSRFTRPYRPREVAPVNLGNTNRLDELLRAGKVYLSLQDAIALALENNLDIELSRYGPEIAEASLLRAEAGGLLRGIPTGVQSGPSSALSQATGDSGSVGGGGGGGGGSSGNAGGTIITATGTAIPNLDPSVFAAYTWGHRTRPLSNTITSGTTSVISRAHSVNAGIQQGFLSGTTVSLGYNSDAVGSNNLASDINPSTTANVNLQISQKLLQGFGLAVNSRNIKIARNNRRVSDLVFRQQVIATVSSVLNLYWDLVSMQADVKVKTQQLELNRKLYSDNKKQVEIGTLAPIEIIRAEAEVARSEQELTTAETQLLQQETIIKNALSRTGVSSPSLAEARIVATDTIRIPEVEPITPVQDMVALALENRPELAQTRIQIDNTKIGIQGSRSQLLPSLDMFANLQNNALAGALNATAINPNTGLPFARNADPFFLGGFGNVFSQLFARNFPDYAFGFQLSIPIRNRQAQADMITDLLNLRQSEIRQQQQVNQIRVEVQNAMIGVQQARARYSAAVKNRQLQEQVLEAEQKKYALGATTIFFVIQYQRDLAQAQATEVSALSAYSRARTQLEQATGQTLQTYSVQIDEAMKGQVKRPPSAIPATP